MNIYTYLKDIYIYTYIYIYIYLFIYKNTHQAKTKKNILKHINKHK